MAINVNGIDLKSTDGTSFDIASGATNWMTVNSSGIIVQPQRPYMKATFSGQGAFVRGDPLTFGNVIANVGNCWNNSTGYFTCPVAGRYLAGMGGIAAGGGHGNGFAYGYFALNKNGGTYHFSHWNFASYWEYVSISGIINCNAGDTISFHINPSHGYIYGNGDHGNFYIALLR